ncbi:hypothetical protein EYR36_002940 [Pleurotus pulmonarius]|nr:hypothetical protein EYR36_002940 [Pleurotus pulmonarius]
MTFNPQRPVVSQPLGRISNYQKVASYAQQLQASTIQNGVDPKAIAEAEVAAIQLATFVRIEEIPDTPGQQGMLKEMKELMAEMQMKLDRRLTTIDTKLDTFATLEVLENRFTTIDMKLDTFATLQALDTRLDGTNAHFGRLEKKVEDMKTKLGVLNDLEENIRELANQVSSNKKLASSVLITAIQALNGSCDNGLLRNYQEVPFPDGTYPSHVDTPSSVLSEYVMENGKMERMSIAMISDFFYPVVGGVENHIYMLSANLIQRGHKVPYILEIQAILTMTQAQVIVITHSHPPDRVGIRWLSPSLKVYYIPFPAIASSATLPNFFTFLPYFRTIVLREHITLIHAHASLSSLGHEGILHSHLMGIRTVFTDHSLFGFEDAASILTNKLLVGTLRNVDAVICVSHTGRENTVLRGELYETDDTNPHSKRIVVNPNVYVIPNSLVADKFRPCHTPRRSDESGDGPKLINLLQMRERHRLQDRIELLGSVRPSDVCSVLNRGTIFMNTSLTESFGISILEAACAGLYVVATQVGGVAEILPEDMISFANPDEDDVFRAVSEAIEIVSEGRHDPQQAHERIKTFYNWEDVAERTEIVYSAALNSPQRDLMERMRRPSTPIEDLFVYSQPRMSMRETLSKGHMV